MYAFGLAVLLGLGVMSVARLVEHRLHALRDRIHVSLYPLLEVAIGVGVAWAVNFNLWTLWALPMRAEWVAITFTGMALGGAAQFFTAILGMFTGLGRKLDDEAQTIERPRLERVA